MEFDHVEIEGFDRPLPGNRTEGIVALQARSHRVTVLVNWTARTAKDHAEWRTGVIAEALRQVRRMPEFRSGPAPRLRGFDVST